MNLFIIQTFEGRHLAVVSTLAKIKENDLVEAHREYSEYVNRHQETSDSDAINFEEWCKIYRTTFRLTILPVTKVEVEENLI